MVLLPASLAFIFFAKAVAQIWFLAGDEKAEDVQGGHYVGQALEINLKWTKFQTAYVEEKGEKKVLRAKWDLCTPLWYSGNICLLSIFMCRGVKSL